MVGLVKVWTRFTKKQIGELVKFRVQELPEKDFETFLDLLFNCFVPNEPLHKLTRLSQRKEALEEYRQGYKMMCKMLNNHIYVCCVDDDHEQTKIVGASIMSLMKKNETFDMDKIKSMFKAVEMKQLLSISDVLSKACNGFDQFDVDLYYKGMGVVVHPDYQGLGIAGELLKARYVICKERKVPLTTGWMATSSTRNAATKMGWVTVREMTFKDIAVKAGIDGIEDFENCQQILTIMAKQL